MIVNLIRSRICILYKVNDFSFLFQDIAVEGGVDLFTNICSNKNYSENLQKEVIKKTDHS